VWSIGSLTNRWASHSDAFQYLLWRSIGILVVIEIMGRRSSRPRSLTREALRGDAAMWAASLGLFAASLGFIYAIKNTTAANASFFSSLSPVVGAVLAHFVLHERLHRVVGAAVVLGGIGLAVMATASNVRGHGIAPSWTGNAGGLLCSVGFAAYMVALRTNRTRDWSPSMPGYAALMVVACAIVTVVQQRPIFPGTHDTALALFHGAVIIVIGTLLFNRATATVPVVMLSLLAQTETIAVPVWIFLAFGERPSARALVGAVFVLAAVVLPIVAGAGRDVGGDRPLACDALAGDALASDALASESHSAVQRTD
jgi:drug/metabolite transporter (DMT)-like permease